MSVTLVVGKGLFGGRGYVDDDTGFTCMTRCFRCGQENYELVVASGYCALCKYDPNDDEVWKSHWIANKHELIAKDIKPVKRKKKKGKNKK